MQGAQHQVEDGRQRALGRASLGVVRVAAQAQLGGLIFALETGELLHALTPGALMANLLALSADGQMLAGSTHDGQILLWDLQGGPETLREPRPLIGHTGNVAVLRFAPDARSLLSVDREGRAIRWADDLPRDPVGLRAWLDAHHDPRATAPPTRSGCIAAPVDAAPVDAAPVDAAP